MYIIDTIDIPGSNRARVLRINGDKLELCTYPKSRIPESEMCKYSDKFKFSRIGEDFALGDLAKGKILGGRVYYTHCNPKIKGILTHFLGCREGNPFHDA